MTFCAYDRINYLYDNDSWNDNYDTDNGNFDDFDEKWPKDIGNIWFFK